ncbi:hypothetical protein KXS11_07635 [Plantibacter flavus]|uniref:hypothetical protein n=1 Tax=Plantibacter flavus TaxID=150123 RepID=UPI003F17FB69
MSQALTTSTARLGAGARAVLELVAGAMSGTGHLEAAARRGDTSSWTVELRLRRLPAVVAVLLLATIVLAGIAAAFVVALTVQLLAVVASALVPRRAVVALH